MSKNRKVYIVGGGTKTKYFHPESSAEIWAINGQMCSRQWLPRVDRAFNIHRYALLKDYGYSFGREIEWAQAHPNAPFYTVDAWPKGCLPNWKKFPRDAMAKAMPRGDYHCGSFDWIVAFAVYLGIFSEISLHGIGLCLEGGEPISARACLEYWLGYAEGRGVKVTTAPDCDFFHFYHLVKSKLVYGYDDTPIYEDRTKKGVPYSYEE